MQQVETSTSRRMGNFHRNTIAHPTLKMSSLPSTYHFPITSIVRLEADQERVESQRAEESRRSLLVRAGAKHRASERRLKVCPCLAAPCHHSMVSITATKSLET